MKKRMSALSLALCLLLAGCREVGGPSPSPSPSVEPSPSAEPLAPVEQVFTLPLDPAGGWDPYVGSKSGNMTLAPLVYEGLYELDEAFDYHPVLAQKAAVSEDGLTWTLTLRDGVTFSNGQVWNAAMAAAAVNAARGEKSVYRTRLAGVKSVTAQEGETLVFTLTAPNARFPALLDFPIALVGEEGVWGTGPYVVESARLVRRADWWRGLELSLEEIPLLEIKDADALVAAFNATLLSLAADDPLGSAALGYAGNYQSWEYATSSMVYLGFQCAKGPCRSSEFRQAVSRAVDRRSLVDQALAGHATPAALPAPAHSVLYDTQAAQALAWDPEGAGQALDELGYLLDEGGHRLNGRQALKLALVVNADNLFQEAAGRKVAAALTHLGLEVEVRDLSWEEYKKALDKGDFDLYLAECRMTGDLDPSPFLTKGSGLYYGGFQDKELTDALAQAKQTGEWAEFYQLWVQRSPLAVLCFKNAQMLTQWGQVTGAAPTQGNLFYQFENWSFTS